MLVALMATAALCIVFDAFLSQDIQAGDEALKGEIEILEKMGIRLARIVSEEIEYSEENTEAIRFEFSLEMEG